MTRTPNAVKAAALVYLSAVGIVTGVALVVHAVLDAETVRDMQRVPFAQLPATIGEVVSICAHNGRILLAAVGAAVAVNSPWLATASSADPQIGWGWRATRALCDVAIIVATGRNLVTVGVGLAVWRDRMLLAIMPHGLVELAAFACGLALYLCARRGPVSRQVWARLIASGIALLGFAALLEVFVVL